MAEARLSTESEKKYDVFLVHASDDKSIAQHVNECLLKTGLKTYASYKEGQEFDIGKPTVDCIRRLVDVSDKVLILLTPRAMTSRWVDYEILQALEKSKLTGSLCIRLVLHNVTPEEQRTHIPDLENIQCVTLDFNRDNWSDELTKQLVAHIKADIPMTDILPAGNVAHGLVYNYFVGFLQHLLPKQALKNAIENTDIYKQNKERTLTKFCVMLPDSCRIPNIEGTFGPFVIKKEIPVEFMSSHGDKTRTYTSHMYRITKDGNETYWFTGECPAIMETMAKLAEYTFVEKFDMKRQVLKFRHNLEDFVNHRHNKDYNDTVTFVEYDAASQTHAERLWTTISEDIKLHQTFRGSKRHVHVPANGTGDEAKYFVNIYHNSDNDEDSKIANEVMQFLKQKNVSFPMDSMKYDFLRQARWNIFVVSKESTNDPLLSTRYTDAVHESVSCDQVQVIPILTKGTRIEDIPKKYKWSTVLHCSHSGYLEVLWKTLVGKSQKIQELLSAGKVYEGLAWAYMLNYLPIALCSKTATGRAFKERFKDTMVKHQLTCQYVQRVFLIVPKTGKCPVPGPYFAGEKYIGKMEPAAVGHRKYYLHVYRIRLENGEDVCYAREFATPSVTLREMARQFPSAGLSLEDMYIQSAEFSKFLKRITNEQGFKNTIGDFTDKCTVVYLDIDDEKGDKSEEKTAMFKRELSQCLAKGDFITTSAATGIATR